MSPQTAKATPIASRAELPMTRVRLDKIASVTRSCALSDEIRVSDEIPCDEGVVIAVEVLTDKSRYNQLELPSGRLATVQRGDIVAGALGHRQALFGYSGVLPEKLVPGDTIHLLNQGGVLGICDSVNPDLGQPFACRVLGTVLQFPYLGERIGIPARVGFDQLEAEPALEVHGIPTVAIVGSCMNCGKTAAACVMVRAFVHAGLTVDVFKATGVSLRRDVLAMEDSGARSSATFTDLGVVTTDRSNGAQVTRTLLSRLAAGKPDLIVVELGDGLLGAYGVDSILADPQIRQAFTAVVLTANDPVATWGGVRILREEYGIEPAVVTGPATDNTAGTRLIEERLGVRALNARTDGERLAQVVLDHLGLGAGSVTEISAAES